MAQASQEYLATVWSTPRRAGCLSPWEEAKVYGLKEAWATMWPESDYGRNAWIADRVWVGEPPNKQHPSPQAVGKLLKKMSKDSDWFPGKVYGSLGGRPPALTATNKAIIATSTMALKARGVEPTYALLVAQCPNASINPATGEAVSKQVIYDILESRCYDIDPDLPWTHRRRLSKVAVLPEDIPKRLSFGKHMLSLRHKGQWYFQHVIWSDICNSVLPATMKKANEQAMAQKGGAAWMSEGAQLETRNMRGRKEDLVLKSKDCLRVYWMPVLTRGKLHLELLGAGFPGDHVTGMETFVGRLRAALNTRFRGDQPKLVFVDRGGGFYKPTGSITEEFKASLVTNGLKPFHGDDASMQPGRSGDLWPHETAVSWVRQRLKRTLPAQPWEETEVEFGKRLKVAGEYVNAHYDVAGLCRAMPKRMHELVHDARGDKLRS